MKRLSRPFIGLVIGATAVYPLGAEGQGTTVTNCYADAGGRSATCFSSQSRPRGWAAALGAMADELAAQSARDERARAEAQRRALDEQYLALVNSALEERAAKARALDEARRAEADAERRRSEAAYRLFQPKLVLVVQRFIDSTGIGGAAHQMLLDEIVPVASDIFLASPDASEAKIGEDLRPLFMKYSGRSKIASGELSRWVTLNRQKLLSLGEKARQSLAVSVEADFNRFVAGQSPSLNTRVFDQLMKDFEVNNKLCLALNGQCDESLLSASQRLAYRKSFASENERRKRDSISVVNFSARFVAQRGSWSQDLKSVIEANALQRLRNLPRSETTNVFRLVQAEGRRVEAAVADCLSGRSCSREMVDAGTYSRYESLKSEAFKKVCSGQSVTGCKALLINSDRAGEIVRSGGVNVGKTPHVMAVLVGTDVRISVGDDSIHVDTVVRFAGEGPEIHANVRTISESSGSRAPSRAAVERSLESVLPRVASVAPFVQLPPNKISPKRLAVAWAIGVPLSGAIAALTYNKELSTQAKAFRDGNLLGALFFMPTITLGVHLSVRKDLKLYQAKKMAYERSVAERDSILSRRAVIVDSAFAAEAERAKKVRPKRSFTITFVAME